MNTNEIQKMRPDEAAFLAALVTIELIIIPLLGGYLGKYGGGVAMAVTAVIGIIAYLLLFGGRLRCRGQAKSAAIVCAVSFALSACLAVAYWLLQSHWR